MSSVKMAKRALAEIPGQITLLLLSCAFVAAACASPLERVVESSQTSEPCLALTMFRALSDKSQRLNEPNPPIMSERYVDLREAMAGFGITGMHLLAFDGKILLPAGRTDDPGIYYFVPEMARRFSLSLDRSIKVFFVGILTVSMLLGLVGFFLLFQNQLSRVVALVGILSLWRFCFYVKDVYVIQCAIIVGVIPLFLYLSNRGKPDMWFVLFTVFAGAGIGLSNVIRRDAGITTAVFMTCILLFSGRFATKRKLCLLLLLSIGIVAAPLWFHHLSKTRDAYLASHQRDSVTTLGVHPFWHPVYLGFSYLTNPYVPKYLDEIAVQKVCSVSQSAAFVSPEYEDILKGEVYSLTRQHPGFIFRTIIAKTIVVVLFLAVYANFGLLAAVFYPKNWPVEVAFWSGLALSSLYGILVMPLFVYLLGFITLAIIYGITSIGHAVESGVLGRLTRWIKIDALQKGENKPTASPAAPRIGTSKLSNGRGADRQPGNSATTVTEP